MGPQYESLDAIDPLSWLTCFLNLLLVLGLTLGTFFVAPMVVQVVRVQGDSMSPTLMDGQLLLVSRLAYRFQPIHRGDIIVFQSPQDPDTILVKRVIALPGESITIKAGSVLVGSQRVDEPYVSEREGDTFGPIKVKAGMLFVMGDHRSVSNDSRTWGLLPLSHVLGRAELSLWPPKLMP